MLPLHSSLTEGDELVASYLPLVRKIAGHMFSLRSFDGVPFEEYLQLGAEGLLQAIKRYDPSMGAQFETYASHRIKGAIRSGLEKATEINQQVATLRRIQQERIDSLIGRSSADQPNMQPPSVQDAFERLVDVSVGLAVAFMLDDSSLYHDQPPSHWDDGSANMAFKQLQQRLFGAMDGLNLSERAVLEQHYFQHDSFELIAQNLSLSKGRVAQLHRQALEKLRKALAVRQLGELIG